jgi:hypothetical protein
MSFLIRFSAGYVERRREGSVNSYIIDDEVFEAFKAEVPEEVRSVTGMGMINFQGQHDRFFLLQDSPGEVARKLNEIVGLSVIDEAIKKVNQLSASAKTDLAFLEKEQSRIEGRLSGLFYVPLAAELVSLIDSALCKHEELSRNQEGILSILGSMSDAERDIAECRRLTDLHKEISELDGLLDEENKVRLEIDNLATIADDVFLSEIRIAEAESMASLGEDVDGLSAMLDEDCKVVDSIDSYGWIIGEIEKVDREAQKAGRELKSAQDSYSKRIASLKICPFCGQKMPEAV